MGRLITGRCGCPATHRRPERSNRHRAQRDDAAGVQGPDGIIAGLDVFDREPDVPQALLDLPNVVALPHIGSATVSVRTRMCAMAARDCAAVLAGERPQHPVNPEVLA